VKKDLKKPVLIFDFDGTLINTIDESLDFINKKAQSLGFEKIDKKKEKFFRSLPLFESIRLLGLSNWNLFKLLFQVRNNLNKKIPIIKPYEHVVEGLNSLHKSGFTILIVTLNSTKIVKKFLKFNKIDFFDEIISCNILIGKERFLKKILKKHRLTSREVLYIGDEIRDIVACQKINVPIVSVSYGMNNPENLATFKPNFLVDNFAQVVNTINLYQKEKF
jgi:phosphoglycolate phosphatase